MNSAETVKIGYLVWLGLAWLGWLASPLAQLLSKLINLPLWRGRLGLGLGLVYLDQPVRQLYFLAEVNDKSCY